MKLTHEQETERITTRWRYVDPVKEKPAVTDNIRSIPPGAFEIVPMFVSESGQPVPKPIPKEHNNLWQPYHQRLRGVGLQVEYETTRKMFDTVLPLHGPEGIDAALTLVERLSDETPLGTDLSQPFLDIALPTLAVSLSPDGWTSYVNIGLNAAKSIEDEFVENKNIGLDASKTLEEDYKENGKDKGDDNGEDEPRQMSPLQKVGAINYFSFGEKGRKALVSLVTAEQEIRLQEEESLHQKYRKRGMYTGISTTVAAVTTAAWIFLAPFKSGNEVISLQKEVQGLEYQLKTTNKAHRKKADAYIELEKEYGTFKDKITALQEKVDDVFYQRIISAKLDNNPEIVIGEISDDFNRNFGELYPANGKNARGFFKHKLPGEKLDCTLGASNYAKLMMGQAGLGDLETRSWATKALIPLCRNSESSDPAVYFFTSVNREK